ncbi:MAG: type II toxin-antitoxin system PemK/MazF family toxin [Acidobacteriota bacterium]|nr:type II toxin-antitoxin system PemK/MazF family toxin [Acidobacteriota bacterium]
MIQGDVWIANLNPRPRTEPGKSRPVIVVQARALRDVGHLETLIVPFATNLVHDIGHVESGCTRSPPGLRLVGGRTSGIDHLTLIDRLRTGRRTLSRGVSRSAGGGPRADSPRRWTTANRSPPNGALGMLSAITDSDWGSGCTRAAVFRFSAHSSW